MKYDISCYESRDTGFTQVDITIDDKTYSGRS